LISSVAIHAISTIIMENLMGAISVRRFAAGLLLIGAIFSPQTLKGRSTFGSVVGNVTDPTGAAIPNSVVTVQNIGTSGARKTLPNETGEYCVLNLDAGMYLVTIEAPGFKVATYKDVVLQARQVVRLDSSFSLAEQAETVDVTVDQEGAPVINTTFPNLFNHPNYAPPNLTLGTSAFDTITSLQSNEGAGPRALQATARFSF
jgi:hypothetical protein